MKNLFKSLRLGLEKVDSGKIYFLNQQNEVYNSWIFEDTAHFSQNTDIFNLTLKENIFLGDVFEDAVLSECASRNGANYIITRNQKDYEKSSVKRLSPAEFVNLVSEK